MTKEEDKKYPVIKTTDIVEDSLSRIFLIDMDDLVIPNCDCIDYDLNGNPKCSVHEGRLQEFYAKRNVLTTKHKIFHLQRSEGIPYCNAPLRKRKDWRIVKGYVTCKKCLPFELKRRKEEITKLLIDGTHYAMEELKCGEFEPKKQIRDLL